MISKQRIIKTVEEITMEASQQKHNGLEVRQSEIQV